MEDEIIYGFRAIQEALVANLPIEKILIQKGLKSESWSDLRSEIQKRRIWMQSVLPEQMNRLLPQKKHQGIAAYISAVPIRKLSEVIRSIFQSGENPLILLIDRVTDVRNLGAIARSAEAFGVHALVLPQQESARINSDAVRASAGALLHLPICKEANLISTLAFLHQLNFQSIAITEKANLSIQTCDFSQPTVLILGSEGFGILPEILAVTQKQVAIPLVGKVSSLNVSVAAGITLYEIARQKYTLE